MMQTGTMERNRRTATITGWLFIATFVTSIAAQLVLYTDVLDAGYITGAGGDNAVFLGALLEMILIVANVGTAIALFSILRRQHEGLALGFVAARVVESVFIAIGLISLLAVVTLRQDLSGTGADAGALDAVGRALVAVHDWSFLFGPGFIVGVGNGLILGYLMYRSGLVPRRLAMLGLIGGPILCVAAVAVLFGVFEAGSGWQALATAPEFVWELGLGIYLVVKGFKPSPILVSGDPPHVDRVAVPELV